jgi:hypothetical protein
VRAALCARSAVASPLSADSHALPGRSLRLRSYDDPNSATSSFSILLGNAPHLDGTVRPRSACVTASRLAFSSAYCGSVQYCVFGKMVLGEEVLRKMEEARAPLLSWHWHALSAVALLSLAPSSR